MHISDDELDTITELAREQGFSAREIAIYQQYPIKAFLQAYNVQDSPIREAYDRGLLQAEGEIRKKNMESAAAGGATAIQIREKQLRLSHIQDVCEKLKAGII